MTRNRVRLAVVLGLTGVILLAHPAFAAVDPPAPAPSIDLSGLGNAFRDAVVSGLNEWFRTWATTSGPLSIPFTVLQGLLNALGLIGRGLFSGLDSGIASGDTNMVGHLSTSLTLDDPTITTVQGAVRTLVIGVIGAGITAMGFAIVTRTGGVTLADGALVFPRAAIAVFLAANAANLMRWGMNLANALSDAWARDAWANLASQVGGMSDAQAGGMLLGVGAASAFLAMVRVAMHGILDLLIMVSPLAFACLAIPWWTGLFWKWTGVFTGLLAVHVGQVLLLMAAAGMIGRAASGGGDVQDLTKGVIAVSLVGTAGVLPAMAGIGATGLAIGGMVRRAAMPTQMRQKIRGQSAATPGANPVDTDIAQDVEFSVKEPHYVGHGPSMTGPTVVLERIPQYGATRQGGETRMALPPPDYLAADREAQRPID